MYDIYKDDEKIVSALKMLKGAEGDYQSIVTVFTMINKNIEGGLTSLGELGKEVGLDQ